MRSIRKGNRWKWLCALLLASLMLVLPVVAVSAEEATAVSAEELSTEPVAQQIVGSATLSEAQVEGSITWKMGQMLKEKIDKGETGITAGKGFYDYSK